MPLGQQRTTKGLNSNWLSLDQGYSKREQTNRSILDAYAHDQWAQDVPNCRGLTYAYKGGVVDAVAGDRADDGELDLADDDVNYVERDASGVVSVNGAGFTLGNSPMAVVTTRRGEIVDAVDWRTTDAAAAGGGSSAIDAGDIVSGILPAARGGTDNGEPDFGDLLAGGPAGAWLRVAAVVGGAVLLSAGVGTPAMPTWGHVANEHVAPAAAIEWLKIDKTGSSLADLTTRSASDLSSGNLAYARMPSGAGTWTIGSGVTTTIDVGTSGFLGVNGSVTSTRSFIGGLGLTTENVSTTFSLNAGTNAGAFNKRATFSFSTGGGLYWSAGIIGDVATDLAWRLRDDNNGVTALSVAQGTGAATFLSTVTATEFRGPSVDSGSATDLILQRNNVTRMTFGATNYGIGLATAGDIGFNMSASTTGATQHSGIDFTHNIGNTATSAAVLQVQGVAQGSLTDIYGVRVLDAAASGTVTTQYGLYIGSMTEGLTNYAIYTNAGLVRFGGATTFAAGPIDMVSSRVVVPASSLDPVTIGSPLVVGVDPGGSAHIRATGDIVTASRLLGPVVDSNAATDLLLKRNAVTQLTLGSSTATFVGTVSTTELLSPTLDSGAASDLVLQRNNVTQLTLGSLAATFAGTASATEFLSPSLDSGSATDLVLQRNNVTQLTLGSLVATFAGTAAATELLSPTLDSGTSSDLVLQRNNTTILTLGSADITPTVRLLTIASTSGTSGFRLPHGTAPSSPVNGDVWTTTAGIWARINGTTYQVVTVS